MDPHRANSQSVSQDRETDPPFLTSLQVNPKDAPKDAEDDDDDLFGSDEESEDEETKKKREENLAAYKKKKEGKTKPDAKSIITMDIKPWGKVGYNSLSTNQSKLTHVLLYRRRDRHEGA